MVMKQRAVALALMLILLAPLASGCWWQGGDAEPKDLQDFQQTFFAMDTMVDVILYTAKDEAEVEAIFRQVGDELARLHDILSYFVWDSDVQKISAAAGQQPVAVNPETLAVVATALEYGDLTQGAFDITLAPVLRLYEFGQQQSKPTAEQLAQALPLVGYQQVELDTAAGTVYLPRQGMAIDLGGIAKGYVVDRITDMLRELEVEIGVVNAGGDINFTGPKQDGSPWRIGIKNPDSPRSLFAVVLVEGKAVVTSGDYERYFIGEDGLRYHHIIDPETGLPARLCRSVTIVAPTAELADLLSTAVFILGPDRGMALVESLEGVEALIWDAGDEVLASSGLVWEDRR